MDIILSNLLRLCVNLSSKPYKCYYYVSQLQDQLSYGKNSISNYILEISFIIFFFFLFFFYFHIKKIKYNKILFLIILNFLLIILLIIIFKNNLPFTDTWYELEYLINNPKKLYILSTVDNFLFSFRIFHVILFDYFFLNYHLITYLHFIFFFFSFIALILIIIQNKALEHLLLFVLIFFSGKWLNIFYEPVNIVWTINFFLLLLFCYCIHNEKSKKNLFEIFLILALLIINFKASVAVIIFSVFYGFCILSNFKERIFFVTTPVFILFIVNLVINSNLIADKEEINLLNYIPELNIYSILKNFFSIQSIIFFPFLEISKNLSFIISLIQNLVILNCIVSNKIYLKIKYFFLDNPLLVLAAIGCLMTSFVKHDILQIRYFSFSLLYQLGFLIFIIKNYTFVKKQLLYTFYKYFLIITFIINFLFFNQGIHFALSKYTIYAKSLDCQKNNSAIQNCQNYIYDKTFYGDTSFGRDRFDKLLLFLKKNNLSIFKEL
jgi:hypothetical protein